MLPLTFDPARLSGQAENHTTRLGQKTVDQSQNTSSDGWESTEKTSDIITKVEHEHDENITNFDGDYSKHHRTRNTSDTDGDNVLEFRVPSPPPDGGYQAWTQVLMGHIVCFNTWGYINSFGVFQVYYSEHLDRPTSDISWIGSVQIFLCFSIGTFSGRASDAGLFKHCFAAGLAVQLLGVFMTSLCKTYWQVLLAQGICTGIGNGLIFCPSLAVLTTYFSRKRAIAVGMAASGTATGGIVFPLIAQHLLPKIGFPWTIRVMGFIMLTTMMLPLFLMHSRLPPRQTGPLVDFAAFKELPYLLFAIANSLCFLGLYFPIYYISAYAIEEFHISTESSFTVLVVLNGCGIAGRLLPNFVADLWLGPLNTMIPLTLMSSFLVYIWIVMLPKYSSMDGYMAFAGFYGFLSSGVLSVFPAVCTSLVPPEKVQMVGVRLGMIMTCISIPVMIGPPIGGALLKACHGGYLGAQVFFGSVLLLALGFLIALRIARVGRKIVLKI